jgi:prephenate dehydrogenase
MTASMSAAGFDFNKLVVFGVGLIGGSLALGLKHAGVTGTIVGVGRHADSVRRALDLGVIDQAVGLADETEVARALQGADLIVLAAPVAQTEALLRLIEPHVGHQAVISDVGSTKSDVVAAAAATLGSKLDQFVPAHPIAGRESSGVEAALADLFVGRNVVVCPQAATRNSAVTQVEQMWRATGALLHRMDPEQHDAVLASVSHLPHVLSFALLEQILGRPDANLKLAFGAGAFRDMTRIAASSPEMWRDVCLANRRALVAELDAYQAVLDELRRMMLENDGVALETLFERARAARLAWREAGSKLVSN